MTSTYEKAAAGAYKNTVPYANRSKNLAQWEKYTAEEGNMTMKFKLDLEEEFGVQNNPKRDMLFGKAWARGHAYGYTEVASVYEDLVELIQ